MERHSKRILMTDKRLQSFPINDQTPAKPVSKKSDLIIYKGFEILSDLGDSSPIKVRLVIEHETAVPVA